MSTINKVAVIGSGVMGSGIAAIIANSNTQVLLLDIALSPEDKNALVNKALDRLKNSIPHNLSHPSKLKYIEIGNLEDDLSKLSDCDLIIEVIIENIESKLSLYELIIPYIKSNAILTSNTSTLPLNQLKSKLPIEFKPRFIITHFFNPPRQMRLVEIVSDSQTAENVMEAVQDFIELKVGKVIVECNDSPGFIANRIGCFLMELALRKAIKYELNIKTIDKIFHKYLGLPKTGIFGLMDLIGLDVMALIAKSLNKFLPKGDKFVIMYKEIPEIEKLMGEGYIGRKGKGGFYRRVEGNKEMLDLKSFSYIAEKMEEIKEYKDLNEIMEENSNLGKFFLEVFCEFINYVSSLVPEISEDLYDIDKALQIGYNWKQGPFQLAMKLGTREDPYKGFKLVKATIPNSSNFLRKDEYTNIEAHKFYNPLRDLEKYLMLLSNNSAGIYRINEQVLIFQIHTKMQVLNEEVFTLLKDAIKIAEKNNQALIIFSKEKHFSAGADLNRFLELIEKGDFKAIEELISYGQNTLYNLKYSKIPVISAVKNYALGGGCEILLHSNYIIANVESNVGLVESNLGLLPGFGGCKEIFMRTIQNKDMNILKNLFNGFKTPNAEYLNVLGIKAGINYNADFLLDEATELAEAALKNYVPATENKYPLHIDFTKEDLIEDSSPDYIKEIAKKFEIFTEKDFTEKELLDLEKQIFMDLIKNPEVVNMIKKALE